jgi:hypothetical protein
VYNGSYSLQKSRKGGSAINSLLKPTDLRHAANDFRYLLNHGYPRKAALDLVGNRYGLTFDQRHLLHRGVFSDTDAKSRREKQVRLSGLRDQTLAIDGHNVLITIEAGLSRNPLIVADDGFLRDISGISGSFKKTSNTDTAIRLVLETLRRAKPQDVLFLFDSPISKSGSLAQEVRSLLAQERFLADAQAMKVPEQVLMGFRGIVSTSDTAIIDESEKVFDLAGFILKQRVKPPSLVWLR